MLLKVSYCHLATAEELESRLELTFLLSQRYLARNKQTSPDHEIFNNCRWARHQGNDKKKENKNEGLSQKDHFFSDSRSHLRINEAN